jgi:hypothetical protein
MFYDHVHREKIPYFRRVLEGNRYKERVGERAYILASLAAVL